MGTAGFARDLVSGYKRVPAPPPKITAATDFVLVTALALGRSAAFVAAASPRIVITRLRDATDEDEDEAARPRLRENKKKSKPVSQSRLINSFHSARLDCAERMIDRFARRPRVRPTEHPRIRHHHLHSNDIVSFVRPCVHPSSRTNER